MLHIVSYHIYKKKETTEGKIYSPSGKFAERAKLVYEHNEHSYFHRDQTVSQHDSRCLSKTIL